MKYFASLFIFFVIGVGTATSGIVISGGGSGTVIVSGDIIIQQGVIICDLVFCPSDSFQCSVTKRSIDNNTNIQVTRNCTSINGTLLLQNITTNANPQPGYVVNSYSRANLKGNSVSCMNCSNDAEATAETKRIVANAMRRVYQATHNLGKRIREEVNRGLRPLRRLPFLEPYNFYERNNPFFDIYNRFLYK